VAVAVAVLLVVAAAAAAGSLRFPLPDLLLAGIRNSNDASSASQHSCC
jgi:hypothetical protein